MSNSLDPDQANVGPHLDPKPFCKIQRLSADDTNRQRVNSKIICFEIGRFSIGNSLDMSHVDHSMGPDQKKMSLML